MILGIDFGTTNTAFSIINEYGEPTPLRFGEAQQAMDYVPSVMAEKSGARAAEYFGQAAKMRIGQHGVKTFENFKMLLGEKNIQGYWGGGAHTPKRVTEKYIAHMLEIVRIEHGCRPTGIVVTIPEIWKHQNLLTKQELLVECFKAQGICQVKVESEAVAAASYYLHRFKHQKKNPFSGYLLVCDCGGGTIDFCLIYVENGTDRKPIITVLERAGDGMIGGHLGSAGVAFDQGVVELLFPNLKSENPQEFFKLVREFESKKIEFVSDVDELLSMYQDSPESVEGEAIFDLNNQAVEAQHLTAVFQQRVRSKIEQALQDLLIRIDELNQQSGFNPKINVSDPNHFRVIMAGGFSGFYLVQHAIKSAFGSVSSTDLRFENILNRRERALAIANGCALIANDLIKIIHTCPANVGVYGTVYENAQYKQKAFPLLKKSEKCERYRQPVWCGSEFLVVNAVSAEVPVFIEPIADKPMRINVAGESLASVLPSDLNSDGRVHIGFSLNDDMIFSLHVRDAIKQNIKITSIGNLLAHMPSGLVSLEGK